MKCNLTGVSGFALRSIVFGAIVHHWQFWQCGSYCYSFRLVLLDWVIFDKASWVKGELVKKAPKTKLVFISWHGKYTLAPCIHQHCIFSMTPKSHPALLLKALPCNVGESFGTNLLPSLTAMANASLGSSGFFVKRLKCLFGLFYDFWGILGYVLLQSGGWHLWFYIYHWGLLVDTH